MKVLILHNDLRVYWKRRLSFLHGFLKSHDIELYAIELFGKGSPYSFDPYDNIESWWNCLFPDHYDKQLSKKTIKKALFSKLAEINPDVIIAGSIVFYSGALGLRWSKNNGKKFIMFDDAKPSNVKRNVVVQGIKDLITSQIDALWLPSKDYDDEYSRIYSKELIHFFHGYNTIDNDLFKFKEEKSFCNKRLICVARLVPIKNIDNLLLAWKHVEERGSDYELVILGDGSMLESLKELSQKLGLKNVIFLGAVANSKIPEELYNSDGFILPSWSESWGLVVNEAMAAGLPVLLSDKINSANTLLAEGINGYSFSPDSVDDIKNKIIKFIELSGEEKKEMSTNSLAIINAMNYSNMGSELIEALSLLNNRKLKNTPVLSKVAINLWHGRYNTTGWDNTEVIK